jgi:hypothetical protein
MNLRGQVA